MVYLPAGVNWKQEKQATYQDFKNYSIRLVDRQLMKIRLIFSDTEKISWKIEFGKA